MPMIRDHGIYTIYNMQYAICNLHIAYCIYIYIYIYVCMHFVYIYICVCVIICMYVCIYVCMYVFMYLCIYVFMYVFIQCLIEDMYIRIYIYSVIYNIKAQTPALLATASAPQPLPGCIVGPHWATATPYYTILHHSARAPRVRTALGEIQSTKAFSFASTWASCQWVKIQWKSRALGTFLVLQHRCLLKMVPIHLL
jgi:hypothetical protein